MRTLTRNKQTIKYAELKETVPIYALDAQGHKIVDFVEGGVTYYVVTGDEENVYHDPKTAKVNIAFSGGELQAQEYGIDVSAYDATILYLKGEYPITDTCLVWYETAPIYKGTGEDLRVDPNSADYKVLAVKPSLNYTKVLLGKLVKNG